MLAATLTALCLNSTIDSTQCTNLVLAQHIDWAHTGTSSKVSTQPSHGRGLHRDRPRARGRDPRWPRRRAALQRARFGSPILENVAINPNYIKHVRHPLARHLQQLAAGREWLLKAPAGRAGSHHHLTRRDLPLGKVGQGGPPLLLIPPPGRPVEAPFHRKHTFTGAVRFPRLAGFRG